MTDNQAAQSNGGTNVGFEFDSDLARRWLSGIPYEVAFWRSYYRNKAGRSDLYRWSQFDKECVLDNFDIAAFMKSHDNDAVITDVGCALSYMFGNIIGGVPRKIVYLDPLAPFYNKILEDYSIPRPKIRFGMGESLSLTFESDSVTFIHIRNALDHSARPMYVIWQALNSLKTGGVLYLNHKPDEAEHEAYMGFHQYNVCCRDGHLVVWNRSETIDVTDALKEYATVEASVTGEGRIVGVITKTASLPSTHPAVAEANRYALGMQETMLVYFNSTRNSMSYQFRKGFLTLGHTIMRLLPASVVRFIKRILAGKH